MVDFSQSPASPKENAFVMWVNRFIPLRRFGWAFLLAWVFCVFYTGVVDGYIGRNQVLTSQLDVVGHIFVGGLPVFMSVLMLVLVVCAEKHLGSPAEHKNIIWLAPLLTAISTPMLFWSFSDITPMFAMFITGSLLTGIGSGLMWVMWGEYYAKVSQEDAEFLAPISSIVAAVLVLTLSSMSGWVSLAMVTSFPLLSGLCFFLSWRDVQKGIGAERIHEADRHRIDDARAIAKSSPVQTLRDMGRIGMGILVACLFVCLQGSFWMDSDSGSSAFQIVVLVSIAFTVAVAFAATGGPRRISISALYRWMCPALVLGFVAVIIFGSALGGFLAYTVSIAARFAFCLITQLYFAQYAAAGRATAVQSFGLAWIFVHLGDFLGVLLFNLVDEGLLLDSFTLDQVCALSIGVLVIVTMFVLSDKKSFAAEDLVGKRALSKQAGEANENFQEQETDDLQMRVLEIAEENGLTPREVEVFDLLVRGRSVPYIRDALFISKETAATHVKHIYAKLGVHSRQEVIDLVH